VGRTEAATVLFEQPAATLADGSLSDARTVRKTGETTVVRSQVGTGKRRVAPWAIGAAALVLIGVLFGGFYAYQQRNNSTAATAPSPSAEQGNLNSANVQPSPPLNQTASEPSPSDLNDVKKLVISNHPSPASEPVKKIEKAVKNNEKAGEKRASAGDVPEPAPGVAEQHPDLKNMPAVPNTPEIFVPDGSQPNRAALRRMGIPTTRNLPDGTQVMTLSDGTRIVTFPNGTKRVFPPGQRIVRRKGLRN
jgi:hypothetical protein